MWVAALLLLLTTACGYHTGGHSGALAVRPAHYLCAGVRQCDRRPIDVGQIFTEAVVKELRSRTNYRIVTMNDGTADATLSGIVTSVFIAPLTYDSATGAHFIFDGGG